MTPPYSVTRLTTVAAADDVAALAREIWQGCYTSLIGEAQVAYMLQKFQSAEAIRRDISNGGVYYTAGDGAPIGYCCVIPRQEYLFLSKLYVREDCRNQGIARAFLRIAVEEARTRQLPEIRLTVYKGNAPAIAFYRKMGFQTADAVVTDIGGGFVMDDYILSLPVPQ